MQIIESDSMSNQIRCHTKFPARLTWSPHHPILNGKADEGKLPGQRNSSHMGVRLVE